MKFEGSRFYIASKRPMKDGSSRLICRLISFHGNICEIHRANNCPYAILTRVELLQYIIYFHLSMFHVIRNGQEVALNYIEINLPLENYLWISLRIYYYEDV